MLDSFKARMSRVGETQSAAYLHNADMIIDSTFKRDPAYREVFVTHIPSEIENRKMDAKFIIDTRRSISGDEEVYKLMFRPHVKIPVGSYVDVPDDTGTLQRWLVILNDNQPQFPMYYILKCNWILKWAYEGKVYKCECVQRTQSSYNSGLWTDYMFTSVEDQTIMWLPTTPYTQTLSYNQRVIICDDGRNVPIVWELSKVLDTIPIGITRLTFKQVMADMQRDCGKYGLASWCPNKENIDTKLDVCKTCPIKEPEYIDAGLEMPLPELPRGKIIYNGKDAKLRVGGSAKTFTSMFWDDLQEKYVEHKSTWKLSYMDGETLICSIILNYNAGLNVNLSSDCPPDIILGDLKQDKSGSVITCLSGKKDIFSIHVSQVDNAFKLKCSQLYDMVGKTIVMSAQDDFGQNTIETRMEVVS